MDDANGMMVVVVCSCYVWGGGGLVCFTLEASVGVCAQHTYYQYVIETCRGTNGNTVKFKMCAHPKYQKRKPINNNIIIR